MAFQDVTDTLYGFLLEALPHIMQRKRPPDEVFARLEERIAEILMVSYLLGYLHVYEIAHPQMADEGMIKVHYDEALAVFLSRVPMSPEDFKTLEDKMRFKAFTVSRVLGMDAIKRVKDYITGAIVEGETITQFIERAGKDAILSAAGFHAQNPWYWETVFRTNVMAAYQAGRSDAIMDNVHHFPALEYIAILDERTTDICRELHGIVLPVDHPFWETHTPPNHFNCRSVVRPVTRHELESREVQLTTPERVEALPLPQEGFRAHPDVWWTSLSAHAKEVLEKYGYYEQFERKLEQLLKKQIPRNLREMTKKIQSNEVTKQVFGDEFYTRIERFKRGRSSKYNGTYNHITREMALNTNLAEAVDEGLKKLSRGEVLSREEARTLYNALCTLLHETVHATDKSFQAFATRHARYNWAGILEECFTESVTKAFVGRFLERLGLYDILEDIHVTYGPESRATLYWPHVGVMYRRLEQAAEARGVSVQEFILGLWRKWDGTPESLLDRFILNAFYAQYPEVRPILDSMGEKEAIEVLKRCYPELFRESQYVFMQPNVPHFWEAKHFGRFDKALEGCDLRTLENLAKGGSVQ